MENKINLINKRLLTIENETSTEQIKLKIKIISMEDKLFLDSCKLNYKKLKVEKNKIILKKEFIDLESMFLLKYFSKNTIYGDYKIIKEYYLDNNYVILSDDKYYYWNDGNWKCDLNFLEIMIKNLHKTYCKTNKLNTNFDKYLANQKHIFDLHKKSYNNKLKSKILSYFN